MAIEPVLSSSVHSTLGSLQRTSALQARTSERISTGKKVNSFVDNPIAASVSQSLSNRASDFITVKNNIGQASSSAQTAINGLDTVSSLLDQAKALSIQRQATNDPTQQANLDAQFNVISQQIDNVTRDASYGGTQLISSSPDNLDVSLNPDSSSSVTIQGSASDSTTLGIDITNPASIDAAQATVRSTAQTIGSQSAVLSIRQDFTQKLANSLNEGAAKLVNADLAEEAANTLANQTRSALGAVALGIATSSERSIIQLF